MKSPQGREYAKDFDPASIQQIIDACERRARWMREQAQMDSSFPSQTWKDKSHDADTYRQAAYHLANILNGE